ncbi:MAG: hypothetical protein AAF799_34200 [Myxococcota bacterium]
MAHATESQSSALSPLSTARSRRKRVILLCSEELRFIACGVEDALRDRGWEVRVEYGQEARPWVQRVPVERPSLRVLCVPGTVDRELADKLRTAFGPDPDADLHILGVDDSRGLVQEIERIAGVKTPGRRSLRAAPRLRHATMVEHQIQTERGWRVGATAALATLAFVLGTFSMLDRDPVSASISFIPSIDQPTVSVTSVSEQPVFSAAAPSFTYEDWSLDPLPEEEQPLADPVDEVAPVIETPLPAKTGIDIGTPVLAEAPALEMPPVAAPIELPTGFLPVANMAVAAAPTQLPPGFLPVGSMTAPGADATMELPAGFLPVAGMVSAPGADPVNLDDLPSVITYSPFVSSFDGMPNEEAPQAFSPFAGLQTPAAP